MFCLDIFEVIGLSLCLIDLGAIFGGFRRRFYRDIEHMFNEFYQVSWLIWGLLLMFWDRYFIELLSVWRGFLHRVNPFLKRM